MIQIDSSFTTVEAQAKGPYVPPTPGGYVFQVITAKTGESQSSHKPMLTLGLDIAEGDFDGAFARFPKSYYQLLDRDSLGQFKALLQDFKASNSEDRMRGVLSQSLQFDESRLVKCLIGGCLREAEYLDKTSGDVKIGFEVDYLCSIAEVANIKPMPIKRLPAGSKPRSNMAPAGVGAPAGAMASAFVEETLPF